MTKWIPNTEQIRSISGDKEAFDRWLAVTVSANCERAWRQGAIMVLESQGYENAHNALLNLAENGHPNPYEEK